MTEPHFNVTRGRGRAGWGLGVGQDRRCSSVGARKVEQICNSILHRDAWEGNAHTKQSVSVFKAKFVDARPRTALQQGPRIDFKTGMHHGSHDWM